MVGDQPVRGLLGRALVVASVGASLEATRGMLPAPRGHSLRALRGWWTTFGPVTATFAAVRLGLLLLVVVWGVALLVNLAFAVGILSGRATPGVVRWLLAWSAVRPWRRLLLVALGLSISSGTLAGCAGGDRSLGLSRPAAPQGSVPPAPLLIAPSAVDGAPLSVGPPVPAAAPAPAAAAAPAVHKAAPAPAGAHRPSVSGPQVKPVPQLQSVPEGRTQPVAAPTGPRSTGPTSGWDTWTVRPGDDFWSIAEEVVRRNPEVPSMSVARYWAALLAANKGRLPVPGDPNLLFPGDRILLPPIGPPGR